MSSNNGNKNGQAKRLNRFFTRPESYIPYRAPVDKSLPPTPESSLAPPSKPTAPPRRPARVPGDDLTEFLRANFEGFGTVTGKNCQSAVESNAKRSTYESSARPHSSDWTSQSSSSSAHTDTEPTETALNTLRPHQIGLAHVTSVKRYAPLPTWVHVPSINEYPPLRPPSPPFPTVSGAIYKSTSAPFVLPLVRGRSFSRVRVGSWRDSSLDILPDLPVANHSASEDSDSTIKASAVSPDAGRSLVDVSEGSIIYFAPQGEVESVEAQEEGRMEELGEDVSPLLLHQHGEGLAAAHLTERDRAEIVPSNVLVFGDWRPEEFNYRLSVSSSASGSSSGSSEVALAVPHEDPLPTYLLERPTMPIYHGIPGPRGSESRGPRDAAMAARSPHEDDENTPDDKENAASDKENADVPARTSLLKTWWKWG